MCYGDAATLSSPMFSRVIGRDRIEKSYVDLFRVFDQWRIAIEQMVIDTVDGGRGMVLTTSQTTHTGELFGYAATGRRITLHSALIFEFSNGLISAETRLYDFTGMLMQLGVLMAKAR
jgi:predicted ester cyclase